MRIPKRYGQSRIDNCPFCGKVATSKNNQGVPVCHAHKDQNLDDVKCACGEYLDLNDGKWGPYFRCINCGNINFRKAMEMNPQVKDLAKQKAKIVEHNKPITRKSDDSKSSTYKRSGKRRGHKKRKQKKVLYSSGNVTVITSDKIDIFYS